MSRASLMDNKLIDGLDEAYRAHSTLGKISGNLPEWEEASRRFSGLLKGIEEIAEIAGDMGVRLGPSSIFIHYSSLVASRALSGDLPGTFEALTRLEEELKATLPLARVVGAIAGTARLVLALLVIAPVLIATGASESRGLPLILAMAAIILGASLMLVRGLDYAVILSAAGLCLGALHVFTASASLHAYLIYIIVSLLYYIIVVILNNIKSKFNNILFIRK